MSSLMDRRARIKRLLESTSKIKYSPAPGSNVFEDNHTSASSQIQQVDDGHQADQKQEGTTETDSYQDIESAHSAVQTDSMIAPTTDCSRESEPSYPLYDHLHTGELAPPDVNFVSYRELLRFPHLHIDKDHTLEVSSTKMC